ncbi:MAG: hypothetical protein U5L95_05060 [Candidatus Saccharibacteria bacterium]|nr:hypothetical protein [Candidatus Saccharibacteria bacterium]
MKIQLNKLPTDKILAFVRRFRLVLFLLLFAVIYVYLLFYINGLNTKQPASGAVEDELETVKRLDLDQQALDRMRELTEENVDVRALYEETRNNPFDE